MAQRERGKILARKAEQRRTELDEKERRRRAEAKTTLERWRYDPVAFAIEALGVEPWERQRAILEAVSLEHWVAVRSGHKVGKSFLLAILALWWVTAWPRGKVLISAPAQDTIRDIVWPEVRYLIKRAHEVGLTTFPVPTATQVAFEDGRRIVARSTDKPERIQGYSGPANLYLIEEASGFPRDLFEALLGNTGGGADDDDSAVAKFVLVGNPTQTSGIFFDAFHGSRLGWKTFSIPSNETPNAVQGRVVVPGLATRDFCERIERESGVDSDLYRVRVQGDFPKQGADSVIALSDVLAAQDRHGSTAATGELVLGVDVARFGDDESVVIARRGNRTWPAVVVHGFDEEAVAGLVLNLAKELRSPSEPPPRIHVDSCGVGAGVLSILKQAKASNGLPLVRPYGINVAEASDDIDTWPNLRSQLWFGLSDWLKQGGAIDPDDPLLAQELTSPKYGFDARGRQVVEPKEKYKARLGRSPDRADALALAVYTRDRAPAVAPAHRTVNVSRWSGMGRGFG